MLRLRESDGNNELEVPSPEGLLVLKKVPGDLLPSIFLKSPQRDILRGDLSAFGAVCGSADIDLIRFGPSDTIGVSIKCGFFSGVAIFKKENSSPELIEITALRDFVFGDDPTTLFVTTTNSDKSMSLSKFKNESSSEIDRSSPGVVIKIVRSENFLFTSYTDVLSSRWTVRSLIDGSLKSADRIVAISASELREKPLFLAKHQIGTAIHGYHILFENVRASLPIPDNFYPNRVEIGGTSIFLGGRFDCRPAIFKCDAKFQRCDLIEKSDFGELSLLPTPDFKSIWISRSSPSLGYSLVRLRPDGTSTEMVNKSHLLKLQERRIISEKDRDGTSVETFLISSSEDKIRSVVVKSYGNYGVSNDPILDPALIPFIRSGSAIAFPYIRGGGECGEDWHLAGLGNERRQSSSDLSSAISSIKADKAIGNLPLFLWTRSLGAQAAIEVVSKRQPDIHGLILEAPFISSIVNSTKGVDPEASKLTPNFNLKIPAFIWIAKNDSIVSNNETINWLSRNGSRFELYEDDLAGHSGPSSIEASDNFFAKLYGFILKSTSD